MNLNSFNQFTKNQTLTIDLILKGYINNIITRYNTSLNIHDLCGISLAAPNVEKVFSAYMYHNNAFCNFVKKNEMGFKRCVENKSGLCDCCKKRLVPFFGKCYMGIEEFVFPVVCEGNLIALICVGVFSSDIEKSLETIESAGSKLNLNVPEAKERFLNVVRKVDFSLSELYYDLQMLCSSLSMLYISTIDNFKPPYKSGIEKSLLEHKSSFIVQNTAFFIKENFNKELSLSLLASNSYCNPSYLSHIFKEKMNISIVNYINSLRIEAAKQLLNTTSKSITEISIKVGFNDSGYFSRLFRQLTGITPTEYRQNKD